MASSTAIIRLKRKRNEDPLRTLCTFPTIKVILQCANGVLDLGVDSTVRPLQHDTIKRPQLENTPPSIFTLALTVDSDDPSIDSINVQDLYKSNLETRPASSDSSDDSSQSKKRAFSDVLLDPHKFRMSRKKPRKHPPDPNIPQDYVVFDAVREPVPVDNDSSSDRVPQIRPSGIPDEIQSGDPLKDAVLHDMLQSYLTIDHENRTYVNLKNEYVYDIYYRTAESPATVPTDANFGVLVYDSEPDSNSEGYYQNSYPDEDEWAGDGWGSDEDEDDYGRRRTRKLVFDSDEEIGEDSGEDLYSYPDETD